MACIGAVDEQAILWNICICINKNSTDFVSFQFDFVYAVHWICYGLENYIIPQFDYK